MSLESRTYDTLRAADLTAYGITSPATQIFRSLGADAPVVRPFVVLTWGTTTPVFKNVSTSRLQVWCAC